METIHHKLQQTIHRNCKQDAYIHNKKYIFTCNSFLKNSTVSYCVKVLCTYKCTYCICISTYICISIMTQLKFNEAIKASMDNAMFVHNMFNNACNSFWLCSLSSKDFPVYMHANNCARGEHTTNGEGLCHHLSPLVQLFKQGSPAN